MTAIVLRFLVRYWQAALVVAAIGAVVLSIRSCNAAHVAQGKAAERARVADSTLRVIANERPRVVYQFVHDTVTLTRRIARTDTLRDSLLVHLTDTVRVKEFIATVGASNQACRDALGSCANLHRLDSLEIVALRSKLGVSVVPKPPRHCGLGGSAGYGVTYDAKVHVGPSLSLGVSCRF